MGKGRGNEDRLVPTSHLRPGHHGEGEKGKERSPYWIRTKEERAAPEIFWKQGGKKKREGGKQCFFLKKGKKRRGMIHLLPSFLRQRGKGKKGKSKFHDKRLEERGGRRCFPHWEKGGGKTVDQERKERGFVAV